MAKSGGGLEAGARGQVEGDYEGVHKCGKRDSNIAPFIYFLFFFFWAFLFSFLVGLCFFSLGNALIMMIITLLFTYNSILQLDTGTEI